jgi:hypothetical protein
MTDENHVNKPLRKIRIQHSGGPAMHAQITDAETGQPIELVKSVQLSMDATSKETVQASLVFYAPIIDIVADVKEIADELGISRAKQQDAQAKAETRETVEIEALTIRSLDTEKGAFGHISIIQNGQEYDLGDIYANPTITLPAEWFKTK